MFALAPADSFGSADRALDRDEVPFRLIQGGKSARPLTSPAALAQGYTIEPCALMAGEWVACCGCGKVLSGAFPSRHAADMATWFEACWCPKRGCRACQQKPAQAPPSAPARLLEDDIEYLSSEGYLEACEAVQAAEWGEP